MWKSSVAAKFKEYPGAVKRSHLPVRDIVPLCQHSRIKGKPAKLVYLSESAARAAIRIEDLVGIVAAYRCPECKRWHHTSDHRTVKRKWGGRGIATDDNE